MKIKLFSRWFTKVTMTAFLVLCAGNAFAIDNKSRVVSPYWQSDTGSYTFIAVSHPSLSGMASQIGVTVNAFQNDTSAFGTAVSFTITSGTTERVFIVRTSHASVNPTSIPTAKFISGTTNFKHGHVLIDPVASNPENISSPLGTGLKGDGYRDVTMLSYWGAVVIEQNTTGFAMEFIGDIGDSMATAGQDASRSSSGTNVGGR